MKYFSVVHAEHGEGVLVECEYYRIMDGWVEFYSGDGDYGDEFIHVAIPPHGYTFRQLNKEEYDELLALEDQELD